MSSVQTWDPALYARNARFVSDLGSGVLQLLAPEPGERILDLGCGDGVLTKKLVDLGCQVVAVDLSAPQIEAARKLGLDAHVMDGEALPFRNEFDATPGDYAMRLEQAGFRVDSIALIPRPTPLPGDLLDWLETFAQSFLQGLQGDARTAYLHEVRAVLEPQLKLSAMVMEAVADAEAEISQEDDTEARPGVAPRTGEDGRAEQPGIRQRPADPHGGQVG